MAPLLRTKARANPIGNVAIVMVTGIRVTVPPKFERERRSSRVYIINIDEMEDVEQIGSTSSPSN